MRLSGFELQHETVAVKLRRIVVRRARLLGFFSDERLHGLTDGADELYSRVLTNEITEHESHLRRVDEIGSEDAHRLLAGSDLLLENSQAIAVVRHPVADAVCSRRNCRVELGDARLRAYDLRLG
jgi:hypothetical protein